MEPNDILYGIGAIFVLAILIRIFGPSKGKVGERKVANKLDWLPRNKYIVKMEAMTIMSGKRRTRKRPLCGVFPC